MPAYAVAFILLAFLGIIAALGVLFDPLTASFLRFVGMVIVHYATRMW